MPVYAGSLNATIESIEYVEAERSQNMSTVKRV